jgi:hypothetical protein
MYSYVYIIFLKISYKNASLEFFNYSNTVQLKTFIMNE